MYFDSKAREVLRPIIAELATLLGASTATADQLILTKALLRAYTHGMQVGRVDLAAQLLEQNPDASITLEPLPVPTGPLDDANGW